jgi:hypothetical protein
MMLGTEAMFTLEELHQHVEAYRAASISRQEFHDWFEGKSFDAYENAQLHDVCVAVDTALSEYFYDGIGEDALKQELAAISRPSAQTVPEASPSAIVIYARSDQREHSPDISFLNISVPRKPVKPEETSSGVSSSSAQMFEGRGALVV